jgi:anion-transporting  ArsA/GET3 family ATPase
MREYVLLQLKVKAMRDLLFRSKIFNYLAAATPGLRELVTIGKIWELALDDRKVRSGHNYDLVIVDAPATGHGVGFLQTPRTFADVAKVGPIRQQAETLDAFIRDPQRTGVAVVALPEEMPVNETTQLERSLADEVGVEVDRIYCNGLYPERFNDRETERIAAAGKDDALSAAARAACRAALTEARRAGDQRRQLERLEQAANAPVVELPFLFEARLGVEEIGHLADAVGS